MTIKDYLLCCLLLSGARGFQVDPSNKHVFGVPTSSSTKLRALENSARTCIEKSSNVANPYSTDFFFYFATESTVPITENAINDLKTFLYYIIPSIIDWCPEHRNQQNASGPTSSSDISTKSHGIIDIGIDSIDLMDGCTCDDADIEISNGNTCAVFQSKMSLYTLEDFSEIQSYIDFIHAYIRRIIDKGLLLSNALPSLKRTRWVGNSMQYFDCSSMLYSPSMQDHGHNASVPKDEKQQESSSNEDTLEEAEKVALGNDTSDSQPLDMTSTIAPNGPKVLFLTIWCSILIGIGVFLLLRTKQRISILLRKGTKLDWDDVCAIPDYYGTGDPPASYHYGRYHFMITGERFLSTRCESCLETLYHDYYAPEPFPKSFKF